MERNGRSARGIGTAEPRNAVRVVVADDDPLVRKLIRDILQRADMRVIAEAATGRAAVECALHYRPDIVVMDCLMPQLDGIEATRRIHERDSEIKIVLLTGARSEDLAIRGLRAGAAGYLSKEMPLEALPDALRGTLRGEAAISRLLAMDVVARLRRVPSGGPGLRPVRSTLTSREWEVLDLLCDGRSTDDIARSLVVSTETVRSHVKSLYRKLGVRGRHEAVAAARRLREPEALA
jgi:NarL family two-component system response regulator LiaR